MLMMMCAEGNRFWICSDAHDQVLVTQAGVNKILPLLMVYRFWICSDAHDQVPVTQTDVNKILPS